MKPEPEDSVQGIGLLAALSLAPAEALSRTARRAAGAQLRPDGHPGSGTRPAGRSTSSESLIPRGVAGFLGFLVPTPAEPELTRREARRSRSSRGSLSAPVQVRERMPSVAGCSAEPSVSAPGGRPGVPGEGGRRASGGGPGGCLVVRSCRRLRDHGYEHSPAIAEWVQPYVEQGWLLTALEKSPTQRHPRGSGRRQPSGFPSFQTDAPLFPYREPYPEQAIRAGFGCRSGCSDLLRRRRPLPRSKLVVCSVDGTRRVVGAAGCLVATGGGPSAGPRRCPDPTRLVADGVRRSPAVCEGGLRPRVFQVDADQSQVRRPPLIQFVDHAAARRRSFRACPAVPGGLSVADHRSRTPLHEPCRLIQRAGIASGLAQFLGTLGGGEDGVHEGVRTPSSVPFLRAGPRSSFRWGW